MPKTKKINKKNAVTFQLVYRSQQDPLIVDEDAPQRVLLAVNSKDIEKETEPGLVKQAKGTCDVDHGHLECIKDVATNNIVEELGTSVFPSEVEEEIGMLAKAAPFSGPQLHLDPDIVAAMDDDFDYCDPENQLEDNFVALADNLIDGEQYDEVDTDSDSQNSQISEVLDEIRSLEESRFTTYSMTSSVIKRNEQLSLLDKRFEKMYADYTDNEIGALDCEEIEGDITESPHNLLRYADELGSAQLTTQNINKSKIIEECCESDPEELVVVPIDVKDRWDCESVLSTYSNAYNHPKLISESKKKPIQVDKRTGIPKKESQSHKLTTRHLCKLNVDTGAVEENRSERYPVIPDLSILSIRNRNETPEERKNRKKLVKEYRKERRLEKKLNTEAFKEEKKLHAKIAINNKNNVQGNKIL